MNRVINELVRDWLQRRDRVDLSVDRTTHQQPDGGLHLDSKVAIIEMLGRFPKGSRNQVPDASNVRNMLDVLPAPFAVFDESQRIVWVNQYVSEMLGRTKVELLGYTPINLWPKGVADRATRLTALAARTDFPNIAVERIPVNGKVVETHSIRFRLASQTATWVCWMPAATEETVLLVETLGERKALALPGIPEDPLHYAPGGGDHLAEVDEPDFSTPAADQDDMLWSAEDVKFLEQFHIERQ